MVDSNMNMNLNSIISILLGSEGSGVSHEHHNITNNISTESVFNLMVQQILSNEQTYTSLMGGFSNIIRFSNSNSNDHLNQASNSLTASTNDILHNANYGNGNHNYRSPQQQHIPQHQYDYNGIHSFCTPPSLEDILNRLDSTESKLSQLQETVNSALKNVEKILNAINFSSSSLNTNDVSYPNPEVLQENMDNRQNDYYDKRSQQDLTNNSNHNDGSHVHNVKNSNEINTHGPQSSIIHNTKHTKTKIKENKSKVIKKSSSTNGFKPQPKSHNKLKEITFINCNESAPRKKKEVNNNKNAQVT